MRIIQSATYKHQRGKMEKSEVLKLEQAAEVHGYRGASKKRHNGVVPIRPTDKQLWKCMRRFERTEGSNGEEYKLFGYVKIVAHIPNGNRAIGKMYTDRAGELVLLLLGFTNYNYRLF